MKVQRDHRARLLMRTNVADDGDDADDDAVDDEDADADDDDAAANDDDDDYNFLAVAL